MRKSLPDQDAPVTLRASSELSLHRVQAQTQALATGGASGSQSAPVAALAQAGSDPATSLVVPAFAATGVALLLGGWVLQRRQRLEPRTVKNPETMQSDQQSALAPLQRSHRFSHWMRVTNQKRLIKSLMWVRTVMGATAILAAIAVVVFWAIETTDMRAGDTGLTRPLLVLLLAGWALSWGAGALANLLHRAFFGRVHPKFDT